MPLVAARANPDAKLQTAVDWLLIKLREEDLPPAFDPRGKNLEVHHFDRDKDSAETATEETTAGTAAETAGGASAGSAPAARRNVHVEDLQGLLGVYVAWSLALLSNRTLESLSLSLETCLCHIVVMGPCSMPPLC